VQAESERQRLLDLIEGEIFRRSLSTISNILSEKQRIVTSLEKKHYDLSEAFRDKTKALQDTQAKYQSLKSSVMTVDQQNAASDEAEQALYANAASNIPGANYHTYPSRLPATAHTTPWQTRLPRPTPDNRMQGNHLRAQSQRMGHFFVAHSHSTNWP
jgi:DNA repair exonuclease SbcCD ATPase subunit